MMDYGKRLVEVDEVLNYLKREDYIKIPKDIIQIIKKNKDVNYVWKYDETKPLKYQNLSRDTIAFLSYLNDEYLLNEEQKQLMRQIYELNERKAETEKENKYPVKDLFNRNKLEQEGKEIKEKDLIEYTENNIFKKVIKKIKRLFKYS